MEPTLFLGSQELSKQRGPLQENIDAFYAENGCEWRLTLLKGWKRLRSLKSKVERRSRRGLPRLAQVMDQG